MKMPMQMRKEKLLTEEMSKRIEEEEEEEEEGEYGWKEKEERLK
jgi:hypothetical protein